MSVPNVGVATGPQSAAAILAEEWSPQEFGALPAAPVKAPETPPAAPQTNDPAATPPVTPPTDPAVTPPAPATPPVTEEKVVEKTEEAKIPLTRFAVFDAEGEVEIPTDLTLEYKVDGKLIRNPVDKVVHLAQQAAFNARQATDLRTRYTEAEAKATAQSDALQKYENYMQKLLNEPEFYDRARGEWQNEQSPENRLRATEAELAALKSQRQNNEETTAISRYTADEILPVVISIVEEFPGVTPDLLLGRLALENPRWQVNGRIPLHRLPEIRDFAATDLREYAATYSNTVSEAFGRRQTEADAKLLADKAALQAEKRKLSRAVVTPVNAGGGAANSPPAPADIKSAKDVLKDPMFGG